ncbi:hypothetical protein DNL40_07895 [Xylanimonas oleitrophica]|uniref:PGAP1-like protein n=1 Tax=Xylanimonas oleitrophica TaxID=2607479 RepID=A0A2W5WS10_9MICO|nr:hypothetical protein [Xylanimonas oleitrophica]PZR53423.1 hypothetical protein DNL40_07895 [Xylanimonas oleitrophica]
MTDAVDTLRVVGGTPLATVTADDVRAAAHRADAAGQSLRTAALGAAGAAHALDLAAWQPVTVAGPPPDPALPQRRRALADEARALAARLGAHADDCTALSQRLLRAAGLYEHAESSVERTVGGLVVLGTVMGGHAVAAWPDLRARLGTGVAAAAGGAWLADRLLGGRPRRWLAANGAQAAAPLVRGAAPWTDETVHGLAVGIASGQPWRARGDLSVTGGARVLSSLVHEVLPATRVRVEEVLRPLPAVGPGAGPWPRAARQPAWAGTPSGTVEEALARTADLYPWGSDLPGRAPAGAPTATLAVERVEHRDGTVSWTVLLPGTQEPLPPDHPFDAVTDLDLMAHRSADVTVAVTEALEQAGVGAGEDVVLVGHSLGGIAAMALAASPGFTDRYRLAGVVTAGSPTATFHAPAGVPVLHLENDEELVSSTDGRSGTENPRTPDRVTVTRRLAASSSPEDRAVAGSIVGAHATATHLRTLGLARASGNAQVADVVDRIEPLLQGERSTTRFYTAARVLPAPLRVEPAEPAPSPRPAPTPPPRR